MDKGFWLFAEDLSLGFSKAHCAKAREMVGWSVEALAFRSEVSVKAIKELELGVRKLRRVTMQALSFSFEKEGLIFIPGHEPMRGSNCRGGTTNPRGRDDFHLIE
ncbi:helix-turn-helix transcriptional regulator [Pseudomonas fluorescens]|nr:helix-turn-helix transcriptional regulator [Pseudomonas fluorescens]